MDFPPSFTNKTGKQGYIANMYTDPDFRGRGIASEILERLAKEARERHIHKLILYASKMGQAGVSEIWIPGCRCMDGT